VSKQGLIERTTGRASFVSQGHHGRSTASGEDRKLLRTFSFVFKGYKLYFWEVTLALVILLMPPLMGLLMALDNNKTPSSLPTGGGGGP
jgi:hypothetical protein